MIIFPAVDIQAGRAVRLKKGKKEDFTVFAEHPLDLAQAWKEQGAEWLHIIDLDGAFDGGSPNMAAISEITSKTGLPCQIGGGIRSLETAGKYLEAGAARLIIGTLALEDPALFGQMCAAYPGRIGVSLDASNGRLKSRGWEKDAGIDLMEAVKRLEQAGAAFLIFTDIERDGMKTGVNLGALADLLENTDLPVIVAGGVSSLDDIKAIHGLAGKGNLEGAISGRAICDGALNLAEALNWLKSN